MNHPTITTSMKILDTFGEFSLELEVSNGRMELVSRDEDGRVGLLVYVNQYELDKLAAFFNKASVEAEAQNARP